MTEILTESFCERCGTRYTFESAAPRKSRLGRVKVLSRGVRNFVMSDESSLSEAMAQARGEDELAATTQQLDAFHKTFNFCLTCRQYTCGDCWNTIEGRCLTCAPDPELEARAALIDMSPVVAATADTNGHDIEVPDDHEAWPEMDLPADRLARLFDDEPSEPEAVAAAQAEPEPIDAAARVDAAAGADATAAEGPAAAVPAEGAGLATPADAAVPADVSQPIDATDDVTVPDLDGMIPGQTLDEAVAAYEARFAAREAATANQEGAVVGAEVPGPIVDSPPDADAHTLESGTAAGEPEPAHLEPAAAPRCAQR